MHGLFSFIFATRDEFNSFYEVGSTKGDRNMHFDIQAKWMKNLIAEVIEKMLYKKFGYELDVWIESISIYSMDDGASRIHLDFYADVNDDDVKDFVRRKIH